MVWLWLLGWVCAERLASGSVTIGWNASPDPSVIGYKIYYGTESRNPAAWVDVGNQLMGSVEGLTAGTTYFFAVTAYAGSGLESDFSAEVSTTLAGTDPPSVSLVAPVTGSSFLAPASLGLVASVTPNGRVIQRVRFLQNGLLIGEVATSPYTFTWNNVAAGNYRLQAEVVFDGGQTVVSASSSVTVNAASTSPTIAMASSLSETLFEAPANVPLAALVVAAGRTIHRVHFYNGSTYLGADTTQPYTFVWTGVPEGTYWVSARMLYGKSSVLGSASVRVSVVRSLPPPPVAPTVSLVSNVAGSTVTAPYSTELVASVVANGHIISKVQFYDGLTLLGEDASAPYEFSWVEVAVGEHSVVARVVYATNATLDSESVQFWVEPPPPTVVWQGPLDGSSYSKITPLQLGANVTSNGHEISRVDFYSGESLLGSDSSEPYSLSWAGNILGVQAMRALAIYGNSRVAESTIATITMGELTPPWLTGDIGSVGVSGRVSLTGGVQVVEGAGVIFGTSDAFHFLYQTLSGDGEIRVRLNSTQFSESGGSIGVMIRDNLTSGSKHAFLGILPSGTLRWQRRTDPAGATWIGHYGSAIPPSIRLRLVRTGSLLTGYSSVNGQDWTAVNSRQIEMTANVFVGLAVASGSNATLSRAVFSELTVVP